MSVFDKDLRYRAEIMDTLFNALGDYKPKMRLLQVDYKENGIDKHVSMVMYQHPSWSDGDMIEELIKTYGAEGKEIGFIVEMDEKENPITPLYSTHWYLEESVNEFIKKRKEKGE